MGRSKPPALIRVAGYLLGGAAVIVLIGLFGSSDEDYSGQFSDFGLQFSNASIEAPELIVTNIVQLVNRYDAESGTLAYITGAVGRGRAEETGPDGGPVADGGPAPAGRSLAGFGTAAPADIVAEGRAGSVAVRVRAFNTVRADQLRGEATLIAESIARVTTEIWPGYPVPVEVNLHVMPATESFSMARTIFWRHGEAFELSIFDFPDQSNSHVPTHELYHVLAVRWELGNKAPELSRLNLSSAMEEVAAELFEHCGRLLAAGEVQPVASSVRLNINDRAIGMPPTSEELRYLFDTLDRLDGETQQAPPGALFGAFLADVYLDRVLEAPDRIQAGSPAAERLLAACRRNLPDPLRLESEFQSLLGAR